MTENIRLSFGMCFYMIFQFIRLSESLTTEITGKRPPCSVVMYVLLQLVRPSETLTTLVTYIRVGKDVALQICLSQKTHSAVQTIIGFLRCVSVNVDFEVCQCFVGLMAVGAGMRPPLNKKLFPVYR